MQDRHDSLASIYIERQYRNDRAREYAYHGYLRRLYIMIRCINNVFSLLPPECDALPSDDILIDATISLQSFVMNVFGAVDNIAWIWVIEKDLNIHRKNIGLSQKCKLIRNSFSQEMRQYLVSLDPWFDQLVDFRDALAHRIPLYIPPYRIPDENLVAYKALDNRKFTAKDAEEYERVKAEQLKLVEYQPIIKHTLADGKPPVIFHFQLLQDFATAEEIGRHLLVELGRL